MEILVFPQFFHRLDQQRRVARGDAAATRHEVFIAGTIRTPQRASPQRPSYTIGGAVVVGRGTAANALPRRSSDADKDRQARKQVCFGFRWRAIPLSENVAKRRLRNKMLVGP